VKEVKEGRNDAKKRMMPMPKEGRKAGKQAGRKEGRTKGRKDERKDRRTEGKRGRTW
jgi:hypothetical protein